MEKDDSDDQLLTVSDAARILGLSRDMVRILSHKGNLPSERAANGYHLFRRKDVVRLAEERAAAREKRRLKPPKVAAPEVRPDSSAGAGDSGDV